jgi:peroxiredoxin
MALLHSTMVPLGQAASDFSLPGVDGKKYSLDSFKASRVLVIIFMCNHCPYVKAVISRLNDLQNQLGGRGAQLVGINSNDAVRYSDDSFDNMKKTARDKKISFPYLFDATQETAKAYDAVCTPDIYLYGEARTLLYRGRIDDNWEQSGKVTQRDLYSAMEAALQGKEILEEQIPSMGCSIKWKQN